MRDEPDPPRKFYGLKPKGFDRFNAPRAEPAPASETPTPSADAPISSGPIDVRDLIRTGVGQGRQLGSNKVGNHANEVHAILRDNLARADADGLNEVKPRPRQSRRRRDYLYTMLLGNTVLLIGTYIMPIFGIAGLIIFNLGATWIIWFVMDDY